MIFGDPAMPTLQQMSFVVIAVRICNDMVVRALLKIYGPICVAFPSNELCLFLNKEIPDSSQQMMYRLYINETKYIFAGTILGYWPDCFCFNDRGFTANNLPSTMWEEMVLKKISCLGLPNILRTQLMTIIRCICLEIQKWQTEHKSKFDFTDLQRYFCWNAHGKIDRMKTVKSLINNESLPISDCYKLARLYGIERDFISLWGKMSRVEKDNAKHICGYNYQRICFEHGRAVRLETIKIYPLNFRAFFSLLSPTEKVAWYKMYIGLKIMDYDDVRFCLSFLEKNEQENILRQYSSKVLQYYLVWPFQDEFLNVSKNIWPYMSIENYIDLLKFIIYQRIMIGWKDFNYVWLLKEFWRQTPNNFKELAKKDEIYQLILPVINCELLNRFPNEVILENYKGNILEFYHVGINYNLARKLFLVDAVRCPK
ncbi:uncharacterized protein TNCT_160751 [Trichonephila clavata]|uniref:Uncharacterized protein n=1 Tax=Trichonephila clavata TaxID=2740835 RepID=A0A8X6KXZ8_TRICU|nr:uncharacterized protein TNCT_160751 [Trichonephila clavata]